MPHVIEPAASGRSRCRGCNRGIAKDAWRFGERLENPYADGHLNVWYHLRCAAYRRPEAFLETLAEATGVPEEAAALGDVARFSLQHRRLCRIGGLERAASGRARCRHCRAGIARDSLRIPLVFHEEGMFNASGFVHLACAAEYFDTPRLLDCLRYFAPDLDAPTLEELRAVVQ